MSIVSFSRELALSIYESNETHPVNFDDAWQWLGYSNKQAAKKKLSSSFEKGLDYSSKWMSVAHSNGLTASRTEVIMLTVDAFKSMGMMAGTSQGKAIRKYFLECEKIAKTKTEPKRAIAHYSERVSDIKKHLTKERGYWCVIEKCNHLLLEVEKAGYEISQFDLLDSSVGKKWVKYREEIGLTAPIETAEYLMPNRRKKPFLINSFPNAELGIFSDWLETIYEKRHLPEYLKDRPMAIVKTR